MSKEQFPTSKESQGQVSTVINTPLNVLSSLTNSYARRLIPFLVCGFFIPFVILVSLAVGYFVWSNLSASWEVPLYMQYGDGVPPYAHVQLPRLMLHQKYILSVDLQLPVTESNLALGNFMTSVTLLNSNNKTLAQARRPAIAQAPQAGLLYGKPNNVHVNVPLINSFIATSLNLAAVVEVGRKDSWTTLGNGQGREVHIAFASLKGLAIPHGIRGLAVHFPMLSSLVAAFMFFLIFSSTFALCVLPLVVRSEQEESPVVAEPAEVKKEKKRSISRKSLDEGHRRRSDQQQVPVKPEATETGIGQEAKTSLRGLRRRSSRQSIGSSLESET